VPQAWTPPAVCDIPRGVRRPCRLRVPGDLGVGVVDGQAADQVNGVLAGADLWWLALSGTVSSVIAPPFQRSSRSARPPSWSRQTVILTSSSRVRSSCLRSLSVVVGAPYLVEVLAESQDRGVLGRRSLWVESGCSTGPGRTGPKLVTMHPTNTMVQ
jgi:hypothetical protein